VLVVAPGDDFRDKLNHVILVLIHIIQVLKQLKKNACTKKQCIKVMSGSDPSDVAECIH
jgi:hypothetical protein